MVRERRQVAMDLVVVMSILLVEAQTDRVAILTIPREQWLGLGPCNSANCGEGCKRGTCTH
jgi:hypothetical protein